MIGQITQPVSDLIYQLRALLEGLTDEQYVTKVPLLSHASIGQHTRHIIEFFLELDRGYDTGCVNYDARERDYSIETQRACALERLQHIASFILKPDKPLILMSDYSPGDKAPLRVLTNYQRELVYNLEHTVHHMALLRIGATMISTVDLPEGFGVAASTIKYRKTCAQ